jgi:hemoglobin
VHRWPESRTVSVTPRTPSATIIQIMATLWEALGGGTALDAVVERLYQRLVADDALAHFFTDVDVERVRTHQRAFLSLSLGGPGPYLGRSMAVAHAGLQINDAAFDRVLEHLGDTLREHDASPELIAQVIANLAPLRCRIVAPSPPQD